MSRSSHLVERIKTVPGLGRDVATVLVLTLLGVGSSAWILGNQGSSAPWTDHYEFSATFDKGPGVRPQSRQEVRIAGVDVGRITKAEPVADGAKLTFSIDPDQQVYDNARLVLRTKSPLNVMYVALDPGGPPGRPLPEGGTIPVAQTERAVQPNEILDKLDTRTRMAVTALINEADVALTKAPEQLPGGLRNTHTAMNDFAPVLDALEKRRANIRSLVNSLAVVTDAAASDDKRLTRLTQSLQTTIGTLASRDEHLSATLEQLPGFTEDLRSSMVGARDLTNELNPTLDSVTAASDELPAALKRLTSTVENLGEVVQQARPVVAAARPVIADLRPFVRDLNGALADLVPLADYLPSATARIVPWMEDLAAFTYQTSSSFSLYDANGGLGRAELQVVLSNPTGGLGDVGVRSNR